MLCQLSRAAASVNICILCAKPKVSAPLTYFQLNAQILHRFSKACIRLAVALHLSMELSRQARFSVGCSFASAPDGGSLVAEMLSHVPFRTTRGAPHVRADRFLVNVANLLPQSVFASGCIQNKLSAGLVTSENALHQCKNSPAALKVVTAVVYFANHGFAAIARESKCDSKDRDRQRQRCRPY